MRGRALLVVALALCSAGCVQETIGSIEVLDVRLLLNQPQILEAVVKCVGVGGRLATAAVAALGLVLWYMAFTGTPCLHVLKESGPWIAVCGWLLTTAGSPAGVERWIFEAGQALVERVELPAGQWASSVAAIVGRSAEAMTEIQAGPDGDAGGYLNGLAASVAQQLLLPFNMTVLTANSLFMWVMKQIAQVTFAWLVGVYWMAMPLVAWTVILPQTRFVFIGWLKSFIALNLWPFFWALAERLLVALHATAWTGGPGGPDNVVVMMQAQVILLILNVVSLLYYAAVPLAAKSLVSGASAPYR